MEPDPDTPGKEKEVKRIETIFKISAYRDVQSIVDAINAQNEKKERAAAEAKRKAEDAKRKAEEDAKKGLPV